MNPALRDWAELFRISNLPTTWSNVIVGVALVSADVLADLPRVAVLGIGVGLFYMAGMALNDAVDATIDARERPARPIPSDRISRRTAFVVGFGALALALILSAVLGRSTLLWGGALGGTILAYDLLHKRIFASILLMGACRGLIFPWAASALGGVAFEELLPAVVMMTVYVTLVTGVAGRESGVPGAIERGMAAMLPVVSVVYALTRHPAGLAWLAVAGLIVWQIWVQRSLWTRPPRTIRTVLGLLVGISLLDATTLVLLGRHQLALFALGCFVLAAWGQRRILGT